MRALALFLVLTASGAFALEPLVTMELRDAEIRDVLRAFGQKYGLNIFMDDTVKGKVTASMKGVPLRDAIDMILKSGGYTCTEESGLMLVKSAGEAYRKEDTLMVRAFNLRYLLPERAAGAVRGVLSADGTATAVDSANSIIVKDIELSLERAAELLERIDRRPVQILIEGSIIEVDSTMNREFGISWEGRQKEDRLFGRPGSVEGAFSVNLPGAEAGGGALSFGLVVDRAALDLRISALEESDMARVLSTPRVLVLENEEASIASGEELLVPVSRTATVISTTKGEPSQKPIIFDAKLELNVRPRVVEKGYISLLIDAKREAFDFSRQVDGFPPKTTKAAKTELIVKDGQTVVIGGVKKEYERTVESGVPVLSKIPLLGWLFKKKARTKENVELLIFLTPRILGEECGEKEGKC